MAIDDNQLAMLLQASRDFAFQQLAEAGGFLPFGTRAKADGEVEFVRFADEEAQEPLEEIFRRTQLVLGEQAQQGEILAAATVANVMLSEEDGEGFDQAIQVHIEAPGYSRLVLAPYRIEEAEGGKPALVVGEMIPLEAAPAIFA